MKTTLVLVVLCFGSVYSVQPTSCPTRDWFDAEFVSIADSVVSVVAIPDPDFSYFKEVMMFTEDETKQVIDDAIEFFNARFGLDFSQSEPNELGERLFQNATFIPFRQSPDVNYTITYNRWIITGKTRNLCFENREGGFSVSFGSEQLLRGSYGGEQGIPIAAGDSVFYGFYNIPVCPQEPIVIRFSSNTPSRFISTDGIGVINCDIYHHLWGPGLAQGIFQLNPAEDGRFHITIRNLLTFPPHPM